MASPPANFVCHSCNRFGPENEIPWVRCGRCKFHSCCSTECREKDAERHRQWCRKGKEDSTLARFTPLVANFSETPIFRKNAFFMGLWAAAKHKCNCAKKEECADRGTFVFWGKEGDDPKEALRHYYFAHTPEFDITPEIKWVTQAQLQKKLDQHRAESKCIKQRMGSQDAVCPIEFALSLVDAPSAPAVLFVSLYFFHEDGSDTEMNGNHVSMVATGVAKR